MSTRPNVGPNIFWLIKLRFTARKIQRTAQVGSSSQIGTHFSRRGPANCLWQTVGGSILRILGRLPERLT